MALVQQQWQIRIDLAFYHPHYVVASPEQANTSQEAISPFEDQDLKVSLLKAVKFPVGAAKVMYGL